MSPVPGIGILAGRASLKKKPVKAKPGFLDFYKQTRNIVILVTCNVCKSHLCVWVDPKQPLNPKNPMLTPQDREAMAEQDQANKSSHPQHLFRVNITDDEGRTALGASVLRLDGAHGYHCTCGNDTRSFPIEEEVCPPRPRNEKERKAGTGVAPERTQFDDIRIKDLIKERGWKPKIRTQGSKLVIESFTEERLK